MLLAPFSWWLWPAQAELYATTGRTAAISDDGDYKGVLLAQGLPFSAQPQELKTFFKDYQLADRYPVFIINTPTGRASGIAYVVFQSEEQAAKACVEMVRVRQSLIAVHAC